MERNGKPLANDLTEIIAGCCKGEPAWRKALYERFSSAIYGLACRMVGEQEAGDLCQEIFLRVFARIASYEGSAAFATWLYRVAVNECLRHLRERSRSPDLLTIEPVSRAVGADRLIEDADLLERALANLDDRLRAIFLLRELEELSYQEIAHVLEIPPGTVASQLSRARLKLQAYLRRVEQGSQS